MKDLSREFKFMREALKVSESALKVNEVPIGCIFVLDDEIIGSGFNQTNVTTCGIRHAELVAIDSIIEKYRERGLSIKEIENSILSNCELYVSVEPCIMCASALRQLNIKKVVFGCGNDRFGGNGTVVSCNRSMPNSRWPKEYMSYPGLLQKELILLLRKFYMQQNVKLPTPRTKKKRIFKEEDIPPINFGDYLSREEFTDFYGEERLYVYDGEEFEILEVVDNNRKRKLSNSE